METKTISVVVPKETQELSEGLIKFIKVVKAALADGFQLGQDGSVIIGSIMTDLAPALSGIDSIPEEVKNTKEFATAAALFGIEVFGAIKGPQAPQV